MGIPRSDPGYVTAAEEARAMLQGVGSRFDFHVCKTLCDLRYDLSLCMFHAESSILIFQFRRTNEMFDIVIDYPDSTPALHDLKVGKFSASTLLAL